MQGTDESLFRDELSIEFDPDGPTLPDGVPLAGAPSLRDLIDAGVRFDEPRIQSIGRSVLAELKKLHESDPPAAHGDIRPETIFEGTDGAVLLGPPVPRPTGSVDTQVMAANAYLAPEALLGRAEPASDIYSLGATLAHLLTGKSPLELLDDRLRLDWESHANPSPEMSEWLDQLLRWQPDHRGLEPVSTGPSALVPVELGLVFPAEPVVCARRGIVVTRSSSGVVIDGKPPFDFLVSDLVLMPMGLAAVAFAFAVGEPLWTLLIVAVFGLGRFSATLRPYRCELDSTHARSEIGLAGKAREFPLEQIRRVETQCFRRGRRADRGHRVVLHTSRGRLDVAEMEEAEAAREVAETIEAWLRRRGHDVAR